MLTNTVQRELDLTKYQQATVVRNCTLVNNVFMHDMPARPSEQNIIGSMQPAVIQPLSQVERELTIHDLLH